MEGNEHESGPGTDPLSDPETLEGFRRRDRAALGRVFDAALPLVYRVAFRMLGDRGRAEDATQETFAKLYRAADRLDPTRPLKPWLVTIALNACRDLLRRRARRPADAFDPAVLQEVRHTEERPEYTLMREEERRLLARALDSLDGKQREMVVLHLNEGHTHEESAAMLGISPAAARKRYSRALAELRKLLRRYEP